MKTHREVYNENDRLEIDVQDDYRGDTQGAVLFDGQQLAEFTYKDDGRLLYFQTNDDLMKEAEEYAASLGRVRGILPGLDQEVDVDFLVSMLVDVEQSGVGVL